MTDGGWPKTNFEFEMNTAVNIECSKWQVIILSGIGHRAAGEPGLTKRHGT